MRGIGQVPVAKEVFDMAAAIDTLFGVGEGRLMMRGIESLIGQPRPSVANPGGTRKAVYLSGVPGSLLKNYTTYFAGFHARLAWRQAGHSSQPLKYLVSVGRRNADVSFVITLLTLHDILKTHTTVWFVGAVGGRAMARRSSIYQALGKSPAGP